MQPAGSSQAGRKIARIVTSDTASYDLDITNKPNTNPARILAGFREEGGFWVENNKKFVNYFAIVSVEME
jgi:hypothetical protein